MKSTIIYVQSDSSKSGVPVHIFNLVNGLKNDFDIKVITPEGWLNQELKKQNIEVFTTSVTLKSFLQIRNIYKKFKSESTIIHCHGIKAGLVGRLASIRLNQKVIYSEHNWTKDYKLSQSWKEPIQLFVLRYLNTISSKIICVSNAVKEFYINKKLATVKKLIVIHNGVEFIKNNKDREKNLDKGILVFGSIGSLVMRKGMHLIIQSFANILKNEELKNKNYKLIILGEGTERGALEQLITTLNLPSYVELRDNSFNNEKFWNDIDVYIQASNDESFGMAIAEAIGNGKPVVASDVGAVREIIQNEELLFEKGNLEDLTTKLKAVINNYSELDKIALSKSEDFRNKFSITVMIKNFKDFYISL